MNSFLQDLRYAARMLAKTPGFTAVAILTLALGIGANVAAFSVVRAVLLRPLPYRQPGQLVRVFDDLRASNVRDVGMSQPELEDLQNRSGVFEDISAVWPISANLTGGDRPSALKWSPQALTTSRCLVLTLNWAAFTRSKKPYQASSKRRLLATDSGVANLVQTLTQSERKFASTAISIPL